MVGLSVMLLRVMVGLLVMLLRVMVGLSVMLLRLMVWTILPYIGSICALYNHW